MLKTSHGLLVLGWAFLLSCAGLARAQKAEVRRLRDSTDGLFVEVSDTGARVLEVHAGGPADRAGLKVGDAILEVNSHAVNDVAKYQKRTTIAVKAITVKVRRGEKTFHIKIGR